MRWSNPAYSCSVGCWHQSRSYMCVVVRTQLPSWGNDMHSSQSSPSMARMHGLRFVTCMRISAATNLSRSCICLMCVQSTAGLHVWNDVICQKKRSAAHFQKWAKILGFWMRFWLAANVVVPTSILMMNVCSMQHGLATHVMGWIWKLQELKHLMLMVQKSVGWT